MTIRTGRRFTAALAALLCLVATGCSGLPTSSSPDVIKPIEPAGSPVTTAPPPPTNADPRAIVGYFLDSNAKIDEDAAKSVLTRKTRTNWTDTPVVVLDRLQKGNPVAVSRDVSRVTVSGDQIGSVDSDGTYTPVLVPTSYSYAFQLTRTTVPGAASKQWRIDRVPKGALISDDEFSAYRQRLLYFFDSGISHFIPDARYSPLLDPGALAQWLVAQLVAQPSNPSLSSAFPPTATTSNVEVIPPAASSPPDIPVRIEVPTAGQLDQTAINALAAQIAATLYGVPSIDSLEITDNGRPVRIPAVSGTVFAPNTPNLVGRYQQAAPAPSLFYVHEGGVYSSTGTQLSIAGLSKTESGGASITSVALRATANARSYDVAAVYDDKQNRRFGVGSQTRLRYVSAVKGRLTRPSWQPGTDYVWVAAGSTIWRVSSSSGVAKQVDYPGGTANITAIHISPDGGRIAVVIGPPNGRQIWEGTIQTASSGQSGSAVSIKDLQPITPKGISVTDAGWYGLDRLLFVGQQSGTFVFASVQCDGSALTDRSTDNLPGAPDSLTVADNALAVVSTGDGTLWKQTDNGASWTKVRSTEENFGINPTYVQ